MFIYILCVLCGLLVGALILRALARARYSRPLSSPFSSYQEKIKQAELQAASLCQAAQDTSKKVRAEISVQLNEQLNQLEQNLVDIQERLKRSEEAIKQREKSIQTKKQTIQTQEEELKKREESLLPLTRLKQEAYSKIRSKYYERAGMTKEEIIRDRVDVRVQEANLYATKLKLTTEEASKSTAEVQAKRIISLSNERFSMSHQPDFEHPGFRLQDPRMVEKIAADSVFLEAFIAATEAEVSCSEDGSYLEVRSVDPLKREIGRRTLEYIQAQNFYQVNRIPGVLQRVEKEVGRELEQAAERATRLLHLPPLKGEVKRLFSRLLYRASYSQNQWHHAVEVAFICGMMAAELGLDVRVARRAGLLHDIGKAMTHDHEGSHALLGAEAARKEGEPEEIANAIAAHHGEEPNISPYAEIVAAGDAISGARPGARREIQEAFSTKVYDLERIALDIPVVERVQVMQGGREMRVFIAEKESVLSPQSAAFSEELASLGHLENKRKRADSLDVTDENMIPIARKIVSDIEEQLTYPGQIRVTVIREVRAVGVAR